MQSKKNTALTLTELLVASIIIGIVMLGIVGIDMSLRRMHQGTSRNAIVAMRTSAMMLHMAKNISQATGSAVDFGIMDDGLSPPTKIWFRRDINHTPQDFSDDTWFCYDMDGDDVRFCEITPAGSQPAADEHCGNVIVASSVDIIGTAATFEPDFVRNAANQEAYVEIRLVNQYDLVAPVSTGNPDYELITRITPSMHGY